MSQVGQAIEAKLTAPLLASAVRGVYTVTPTGDLLVNITSHAPRTILVTGVTILWSDNTTTILDRWNNTATTNIQLTITHPDGTTETLQGLPAPLAPGDTLTIVFQGYAANRQPVAISASLSASPIVAVIPVTPPTPAANITPPPPPPQPQAELLAQLNHVAYNWTVTWAGSVSTSETISTSYAEPEWINIPGADPSEVKLPNDNALAPAVNPKPVEIIQLTNNTIYADNFDDCSAIGSRWRTEGGQWANTPEGLHGCGIAQTYPYTGRREPPPGLFDYEYVAAPSQQLALPEAFYILVHVRPMDDARYGGKYDVVLYYDEFNAITVSVDSSGPQPYFEQLLWLGDWYYIDATTISDYSLEWYSILAYVNSEYGLVGAVLYNADGSVPLISRPIYWWYPYDSPPIIVGVGTGPGYWAYWWYSRYSISSAYFDDFIVSRANPSMINLSLYLKGAPLGGAYVAVNDSFGDRVSEGYTDSTGFVSLNAMYEPILNEPVLTIAYSFWSINVLLNQTPLEQTYSNSVCGSATLCGGESYLVNITPLVVNVSTRVDIEQPITRVVLEARFRANVSMYYELLVYNWTAGRWVVWDRGSVNAGEWVAKSYPYDNPSDVISDDGTVLLALVAYSGAPLQVDIDELNVVYYYRSVGASFDALLVGIGGSNVIEVYNVSNGRLTYLYDVPAGCVFDGSCVFVFDNVSSKLVLFNSSGIFALNLSQEPGSERIDVPCAASANAELAVVVNGGYSYVVALQGAGSDYYCIINVGNGAMVSSGSLSAVLGFRVSLDVSRVYGASASDGSRAFFLVYDEDAGMPVIVEYDAATSGWRVVGQAPGGYVVGMAYGGGYLWLLLKGGSLYKLDPASGSYELVVSNLPFYPWEPGDRLEYIPGLGLVFVRDDGTREVWLIPA